MVYTKKFKYRRPMKKRRKVRKAGPKVAKAIIYRRPTTQNQIPRIQKLRYVDYFTLNTGAGTTAQYAFRANGLHDPNITGIGHQPMKWDQMKLFYNHYVVLGSKITMKHVGGSVSTSTVMIGGVHLDDDTTIPGSGDLRFIAEQGRSQYKLFSAASDIRTTWVQKFSAKRFFNVKDVKDNLSRLGSAVTGDPSEGAVFNCWISSANGTTTGVGADFVVTIDYIVAFSEPSDVTYS